MSLCRSIGAGAKVIRDRSGAGGGAATSANQGGGNKKEGLVSTTNMRARLVTYVRTRADGGAARNWVFCMNQLGGVGRRWGQAAGPGNRGGVHMQCAVKARASQLAFPRRPKQSIGFGTPVTFRANPMTGPPARSKAALALLKQIQNQWDANGIIAVRIWDHNLIEETDTSEISLSVLQKSAVLNGLYGLGDQFGDTTAGIVYNTWDGKPPLRIDCSYMFNAWTPACPGGCAVCDKPGCPACETPPLVTSCKCGCRGGPPAGITFGNTTSASPDGKRACTCGGSASPQLGEEPDPSSSSAAAAAWCQSYVDFYQGLPTPGTGVAAPTKDSIPHVSSGGQTAAGQCCFQYTGNMMAARNKLLPWMMKGTNAPGYNEMADTDPWPSAYNEGAYRGNQMQLHAAYMCARAAVPGVLPPAYPAGYPADVVETIQAMRGYKSGGLIVTIDNVPTDRQANGKMGEPHDPSAWKDLPELVFDVYDVVDTPGTARAHRAVQAYKDRTWGQPSTA
jgi:hypothetical protein